MVGKTKTLAKASNILSCFTPSEPTWTATQLSKKLGIPVTTLHGILSDLVALDFLTQSQHSKTYKIGSRYMEMGFLYTNNSELNNIAHGTMRDLAFQTNQIIGLSVLYKGWMYVSLSVLPVQTLRELRYLGPRLPAHMSAGGMAILAQLPTETVKTYLSNQKTQESSPLNSLPPNFDDELILIRNRGYALGTNFSSNQKPCTVGVPIFGREKQVIAGLVVIGTYEGFSDDTLAQISTKLIFSADNITQKCGHLPPLANYV